MNNICRLKSFWKLLQTCCLSKCATWGKFWVLIYLYVIFLDCVHLPVRLAQLDCAQTQILAIAKWGEKVRMRISCWTNQLHLIHGKPVGSKLPTVGSSYCFLIVCPPFPPPPPLPRHSAIAHAILVPLYNYIQLKPKWIILLTLLLIGKQQHWKSKIPV